MKRFSLAIFSLLLLASASWAQETRYVYEVQQRDALSSSPWSLNMGAMAEAARLYAPVTFSKVGSKLSMSLDTSFSFSLMGSVQVERSDTRMLMRHEVRLDEQVPFPKATKRSTIRFSLSDLIKKGGSYALSPLQYAIRKAIDSSSQKSGRAWITDCSYACGRFVVTVAFTGR
ncbi:MAG: hypothetical protein RBT62_07530 [Spirochaetia bacterium]|jgi:hypothetical protein|nr:hypothetical protein [Spirochaetia bacterium]